MPEIGIARRYAAALFATANSRSLVDKVEADLKAIVELLGQNRALRAFMHSPQVLEERRREMLHKALGERVDKLVLHFLLLLIKKSRFDHLDEIAVAFSALADEHRGVVRSRVTTVIELSPEMQERLQQRLAAITGKQVVLACDVEPALIGGVKVVLDDQLLDGSVSRALERLHEDLAAVSVI